MDGKFQFVKNEAKNKNDKKKKILYTRSFGFRLFFIFIVIILSIIMLLVLLNNVIFETFYLYSKEKNIKETYNKINQFYNSSTYDQTDISSELEKIAINNGYDIVIKTNQNTNVYSSNKDFMGTYGQMNDLIRKSFENQEKIIYKDDNMTLTRVEDTRTNISYILLTGNLDVGYSLYIRMPETTIKQNVDISNRFLYLIASFVIIIGGIIVLFISKSFSKPISQLNEIARKMSNLDFSQKYLSDNDGSEIDELGKSINSMSNKLEITIHRLRENNIELERDIEEKSKIDEMRKSFISDVSHELKTPIALIQAYSEGLLENVNADEENRKFYAEVILDETNKMDRLVKQLLELMKLEYGKREFDNKEFNIADLEKEVLRNSKLMIEEKEIQVSIENDDILVYADDFYIEQVLTNYITNAIKNIKEINGKKLIRIENKINTKTNKLRVSVFNSGENIEEENLSRIWNRFYKVNESRNREDGGTGIGLSLVKAIMNNYENNYGVENKENGVEFYFELDIPKDK